MTQPVSRYVQIANDLAEQIRSGRLQPGQRLPTRVQLAAFYEVSETTVYRSLGLLADRGLTNGHQGKAVYVAGGPEDAAAPTVG